MPIHQRGREAAGSAALLLLAVLLPAPAAPGEWPQLWGPTVSASVELAATAGRPSLRELWRRPLGSGFSGIALAAGRGYTGETDGTTDHAIAFELGSGRTLWRAALGETYRGHDGSRDGPIATPAVGGGRVFMAGPRGLLLALDAQSGRELWRKDLLAELAARAPFYGFGASPILVGERVVIQLGGPEKSGLVALEAASGRLAWSARPSETKGDSAGYTMAVPAELGGEHQLIVTGHDRVFAVRASDGAVSWSHALAEAEEPTRPPLALAPDRVLVSRGTSSTLLRLVREAGSWKAEEVWRSPRLKGGLSPTVHRQGSLFGYSGQYLLCVDAATGEPRWREKTNAGALIRVGSYLVVLGEQSGLLRIVEARAAGYLELARAAAFNAGAQSSTGPSYADGRIFVRNVEELVAFAMLDAADAGAKP